MKTSTSGLRTLLHGSLNHVWADFYTIILPDASYWTIVVGYPGATTSWTSVALGGARTYYAAGYGNVPGVKRQSAKEKIGLDVDELKIDLICGDLTQLMATGLRVEDAANRGMLDGATVVLERVYYSDAAQTAAGSVYRYNGLVTKVDFEAGTVTLTVTSPLSQLSRTLPRNFYTPLCGHSLFDSGCAVARVTWSWTSSANGTVDYSADGITSTQLWVTKAATVAAWTTGFIASIGGPTGQRHNCTYASVSGGGPYVYVFTLDQPQPVAVFPGSWTATIEARCDKSIAMCRDRYANLTRRTGFDFIPAPDAVTRNTGLRTYSGTVPESNPESVGSTSAVHTSESRFTAQTSAYGRPIPIVFGTARIGGNIVLAGTYFTNATDYAGAPVDAGLVQLGLCEGPIDSVLKCWIEKTVNTPAGKGWTILAGTRPQSPWAALVATNADIALGYSGVALVCSPNGWSQAATGELENATYVVSGFVDGSSSWSDPSYPAANDKDSGWMISVVLTNTDFGLGCTLSVDFGSGTGAWAAHAAAMGAFISMAIVEAREAREIVGEMVSAVNGAAVWSEGHLKLFPLTTEKLVNGAAVYTPVVTPAYDLGGRAQGSDFLADQGQAPIQVERVANVDRFNCFPIEYTSRSSARVTAAGVTLTEPNNEYTKMTYDGDAHPTDSQVRGVLKAPVLSLPCITRLPHVKLLSRLLANQSVAKTATYRFRLGWRFALLECGDLVTITEANLGLARQLVRVTEISEGDDGGFDVVAEGVGYSGTIPAATYSVS